MSELIDNIWEQKYRPTLDEIVFNDKKLIIECLKNPKTMPSFIFYSTSYGTGKTSLAHIIIDSLKTDGMTINASSDRGIDIIRDKIKVFASSLCSNPKSKRCVFLDEACGLTIIAQESLKNLMDTYSDNCFFIFSCNNVSKIDGAIRSRCKEINFNSPNREEIKHRLKTIISQEKLEVDDSDLDKLILYKYPDIRSMIKALQIFSINKGKLIVDENDFKEFWSKIKERDVKYVFQTVYSGTFDIMAFNKWLFNMVFDNGDKLNMSKLAKISEYLADTEKNYMINVNLEIIFLCNIMKIMELL